MKYILDSSSKMQFAFFILKTLGIFWKFKAEFHLGQKGHFFWKEGPKKFTPNPPSLI